MGHLKGNLVLGLTLHVIRMSCLLIVLPGSLLDADNNNSRQEILSRLVLYSWAFTEVGRYPMYLFPSSSKARLMRLSLPMLTFPVGAFVEAVGAYRVLMELLAKDVNVEKIVYNHFMHDWVKVGLLGMVVLVNSSLGPTLAYPALLKKGIPALMGKSENRDNKRKKTA